MTMDSEDKQAARVMECGGEWAPLSGQLEDGAKANFSDCTFPSRVSVVYPFFLSTPNPGSSSSSSVSQLVGAES